MRDWRRSALVAAFGAAALAMAGPSAAVNTALWGYGAAADGGKAESCTDYGDDGKACAIVFCRGDGVLQLGLEPTLAAGFVEDQPGFAAVGPRVEPVTWALVEGLEPGKPLWIADLEDVAGLMGAAAGQPFMTLGIGPEATSETPVTIVRQAGAEAGAGAETAAESAAEAQTQTETPAQPEAAQARETLTIQGGASTTYHFTTASSELALQLLTLKCARAAAAAANATPAQ